MATKAAQSPQQDQRSMMSMRTIQLTATKTPATTVGEALATAAPATSELMNGIPVSKITSRGGYKQRTITISKDCLAIFCTHRQIEKNGVSGVLSTVAHKLPIPLISRKGVVGFSGDLRSQYIRYVDVADIDYVCTGTVSTRKLERTRTNNRLRGADSKIDTARQEIVTIGHHGDQTLDILVANEKERNDLIACVKKMCDTFAKAQRLVSHDALLLRYIWYDVDANRDGLISEKEFVKIMSRINFNVKSPGKEFRKFVKERKLKKAITLADVLALLMTIKNKEGNGSLSMANILWDDLFGSNVNVVDAQTLLTKFVHGVQGETSMKLADVKQLITTINSMEINHNEGEPANMVIDQQISRPRFEVYLYHELNDAYDPRALELEKKVKLNRPMSHYYINTSHNTYLSGDQLQSVSSVQCYGNALRRGCKCLELDCWDGDKTRSKQLYPVVYHGYTITSKILFADILQVVKNYLDDHPDTYPIILSLENHCSHPSQIVMAKALTDTFKNKLYVPRPEDVSGDLPAPEELRGMVVIKGKRPPESEDNPVNVEYDEEIDQYDTSANEDGSPKSAKKKKGDPNGTPAKPPKVVKELARLTLFHGTKFKEFEKSIGEPPSHMHSIGESKITSILSKTPRNAPLWRQYNVHHMTRTYPAGARVDSSNYNPLLAWAVGCQLVALNFQTSDAPLILNDGIFRQNSGCGYLPKPAAYLEEKPAQTIDKSKPVLKLKIRVLSGSCLPKPLGEKSGETIDPYVQVTLHDVMSSDDGSLSFVQSTHTTSTVNDNGFCPVWNEKTGKEFPVYSPEISMVQFFLREADIGLDDDVGFAAIPISCLRQGYRSIQLYDRNNTRTGPFNYASVLVHIQMTK